MQFKSLIENAKMIAGLVRIGAIGFAAGCVVELIEASPAFGTALSRRMLSRDFDRLRLEFERQGADTTRLVERSANPGCDTCRRELH